MSIVFNADEIFEIAEQLERNGAKFYRRAAERTGEKHSAQLLLGLAAMEDEHAKIFASMRAELNAQERMPTVFDPEGETAQYLRAMADGYVFDLRSDPSERLTGKETMEEILRTAIGLEKDSIVFYLGIKEMVPENLGRSRIEDVIKQEMAHVTALSKELAAVQQ